MKFLLVSCCLVACAAFTAGFPAADEDIKSLVIISRAQWGAQPPKSAAVPLKQLPPSYAIISHTASNPCTTQIQCVQQVRNIQANHMQSKGWDDIGYNFLVGGDGNVYEGRGWDVTGAHTMQYNTKSIGITFIGTFTNAAPTDAQVAAAQNLLKFALENGKFSQEYKLLGHRQVVSTESPGQKLYEIIQTWDHWSPTP